MWNNGKRYCHGGLPFLKSSCGIRMLLLDQVISGNTYSASLFTVCVCVYVSHNWLQVWLKFTLFLASVTVLKTGYYINLRFQTMSFWYLLLGTLRSRNIVRLKRNLLLDTWCYCSHQMWYSALLSLPIFIVCKTHLHYWSHLTFTTRGAVVKKWPPYYRGGDQFRVVGHPRLCPSWPGVWGEALSSSPSWCSFCREIK